MLLHSMAGTGKSFTINADEQPSKGAKEQRSKGAAKQPSKGAAEQRSCAAAATHLAPEHLSSQAAEQWSNWDIGQLQT